jgi:hypothetical protein
VIDDVPANPNTPAACGAWITQSPLVRSYVKSPVADLKGGLTFIPAVAGMGSFGSTATPTGCTNARFGS